MYTTHRYIRSELGKNTFTTIKLFPKKIKSLSNRPYVVVAFISLFWSTPAPARCSAVRSSFIVSNYLFTTTSLLLRFDVDECAAIISISYTEWLHCRCNSNDDPNKSINFIGCSVARVFGNKVVKCTLPPSAPTA